MTEGYPRSASRLRGTERRNCPQLASGSGPSPCDRQRIHGPLHRVRRAHMRHGPSYGDAELGRLGSRVSRAAHATHQPAGIHGGSRRWCCRTESSGAAHGPRRDRATDASRGGAGSARPRRGYTAPQRALADVDLAALVARALDLASPELSSRGIGVSIDSQGTPMRLLAEPDEIGQVVTEPRAERCALHR